MSTELNFAARVNRGAVCLLVLKSNEILILNFILISVLCFKTFWKKTDRWTAWPTDWLTDWLAPWMDGWRWTVGGWGAGHWVVGLLVGGWRLGEVGEGRWGQGRQGPPLCTYWPDRPMIPVQAWKPLKWTEFHHGHGDCSMSFVGNSGEMVLKVRGWRSPGMQGFCRKRRFLHHYFILILKLQTGGQRGNPNQPAADAQIVFWF